MKSAPPTQRLATEPTGHPDTKWGGSVMAALQLKNLPTGAGDDIKVDVSYARGNTRNVLQHLAQFAMFGDTGLGGAYQSIGFGQNADGVFAPGGDIKLVTAYGIRGAFNHNWDPYWSTSLFGAYAAVRYGGSNTDLTSGKGQWCANYNAGKLL